MSMILKTQRLALRELEQADFQDLADMLQNPKVMYAYEHSFSDQDVQIWLDRQRKRYDEYGFGLWAVEWKATGQMIGQAGLTMQPYGEREVLELGYLLKEDFWGYGYATEAAEGCKEYAFQVLKQSRVYSIIKADNVRSIHVARRIGMEKESEFFTQYFYGRMLHTLYSVQR